MFESLIEDCVALPESTLDERLRANESAGRRLAQPSEPSSSA